MKFLGTVSLSAEYLGGLIAVTRKLGYVLQFTQ